MWRLYERAKKFGQLPSMLLGLSDSYVAYCFDECIDTFGTDVENELNAIKRNKKEKDETYNRRRHQAFMKMLGLEAKIKFASPISTKVVK